MHFQPCISVMPRRTNSIHLRLEDASCMLTVIMTSAHQCWKLTNEQKIYAKTHLNETNETRKNAVAEIKHWIQENNDLRKRIDDFNILQYLRICKFNIEETKIRIQNYYKLRSNIPEWYTNKDPFRPELQILLNLGIFFFLRKPDNEGRMVFFVRPSLFEPKISKLSDVIKIGIMMIDLGQRDYVETSLYGYNVYIDLSGLNLHHITAFRPRTMINVAHL
ncbi:hypothetical protein P5V15_005767 [Pogonomyrmex californicus]